MLWCEDRGPTKNGIYSICVTFRFYGTCFRGEGTRSLFLKLSHCQLMSLGVGALGLAEQDTR